jgi:mannose-6-phosphate isomerase-like protein (cupin superfamily)
MAASGDKALARPRGAAKKEAFFRATEEKIQTFSLADTDALARDARTSFRVCDGDVLRARAQTLPQGFANTLHYHPLYEGIWMVLRGRVRFYGPDETVIGEFGPLEGVYIPRNGRYWFAQVGEEAAQILQIRGDARDGSNKRVDLEERRKDYGTKPVVDLPG